MPGWCILTNSFARANPLIGLTEEEYRDLACALVSYVALHATADETAHFVNLCREHARAIADKVAAANKVHSRLVSVSAEGERAGAPNPVMRSVLKKSRSH
jgi:hypothetical protein